MALCFTYRPEKTKLVAYTAKTRTKAINKVSLSQTKTSVRKNIQRRPQSSYSDKYQGSCLQLLTAF